MLLVSGLQCGAVDADLPMQLLVDFVAGHLGGAEDHSRAARIARVIVAGNSVAEPSSELGDKVSASLPIARRAAESGSVQRLPHSSLRRQSLSQAEQARLAAPQNLVDEVLAQLASSVPVDVMPGPSDPANFTLPQQPLHPCLLPLAARYSSFRSVTNPYECSVAGVRCDTHTQAHPPHTRSAIPFHSLLAAPCGLAACWAPPASRSPTSASTWPPPRPSPPS